jgi:hypothetical protein
MQYDEVVDILGKPTDCESSMGTQGCVWESGQKSISVKFIAEKAVYMSKNL